MMYMVQVTFIFWILRYAVWKKRETRKRKQEVHPIYITEKNIFQIYMLYNRNRDRQFVKDKKEEYTRRWQEGKRGWNYCQNNL